MKGEQEEEQQQNGSVVNLLTITIVLLYSLTSFQLLVMDRLDWQQNPGSKADFLVWLLFYFPFNVMHRHQRTNRVSLIQAKYGHWGRNAIIFSSVSPLTVF